MPTVRLSPVFNEQVETSAGAPASGWSIYTYAAGSTTPQPTYTSSAGTVSQSNPIILGTDGAPANPIWLASGQAYKFVLKDAQGVTQRTIDNVSGINDTTTSVSQWVSASATPTYVSASSFTLVGDQTSEFHVGRRLQFTVTAGTVYGVITASAYTTLTTVTVALDAGALDAGLSAVNLSILRADNSALPKRDYAVDKLTASKAIDMAAAVSLASAGTTDIGAAASNNVSITGTTAITSLGTANAGIQRDLTFAGALTLTHNATSLILPTAANITTAAGDTARFVSLGSGNWRCLSYQRADGTTLGLASNSEAQALSNALKAITPATLAQALKGANQSLATPGYQKLPGGLIVQWLTGSTNGAAGTGSNHNFPLTFPTACLGVFLSPFNQTVGAGSPYTVSAVSAGTTLFTSQASAASIGFFAVAIGY